MVGASGFEPPASASRTRRANQAALRPDNIEYYKSKQGIMASVAKKYLSKYAIE